MSTKQFQQELSKGFPFPVYLFYSSDDFLLYEALSTIKERYYSDAFNFDILDAASPDSIRPMEQIIDILNTMPFLSKRRVVIIENIQKLSKRDIKKLDEYLSNPSSTSLLMMFYKWTPSRPLNASAIKGVFDASALKNIKTIGFSVSEADIPFWIGDKAKTKGIEFTDRAIEYLIACVGTDIGMLYSEIEKFSSWSAGKIDIDDIKGIVYAGAEYSAFDLIDAINKRDTAEVFRVFEKVSRNTEPEMLLGALNWQYTNPRYGSHERDEGFLRMVFKLLHQADASIKTSHSNVMEDLLIKLLKTN